MSIHARVQPIITSTLYQTRNVPNYRFEVSAANFNFLQRSITHMFLLISYYRCKTLIVLVHRVTSSLWAETTVQVESIR